MSKRRCEIVAEIGIGHDGYIEKAMEMIQMAKLAGADTVKFQLVDPNMYPQGSELYDIFKRTYLDVDQHKKLKEICDSLHIKYLCTPSDIDMAIKLVEQVGVKRIKIASDSMRDQTLLGYVESTGLPFITSTGMADEAALDELAKSAKDCLERVTVLHCVSKYPCPDDKANLYRITSLQSRFEHVGYSDHTSGILATSLAIPIGVEIIEKHFKIDDKCVDAPVSLFPHDFWQMVKNVRQAEEML